MRSLLAPLFNKAPIPYTGDYGGIAGLFTGKRGGSKTDQLQTMGSVGTVFAIVHATSTATAAPAWHMHRKLRSGTGDNCPLCDAENVELILDHQALRLINRPNDFYSGTHLREAGQQHKDLAGETWVVVERAGSVRMPIGLWCVRPDRMEVVASQQEFIAGYIYHGPSGEKIPLQVDEVLRQMSPDPEDPYRGMGPVQAIMREIDSSRFGAEWNRNFFLNSAEPGGIIQTERRLSDTEWRELTTRWREGHKGVRNAHRVAVLEGHKWVERSYSPRDIQFKDLREVSRDSMLEAFGMSKFGIGIIDDVNRATAEAATAWFAQQMTVPRLEGWKAMFDTQLLPMLGTDSTKVETAYANPIPPDREAENAKRDSLVNAWAALVNAGADPDDAADYLGIPHMKMAPKPEPPAIMPGAPAVPPAADAVVLPFVRRPPQEYHPRTYQT
jgi:HK97 family phage portal protein